jgi:hypothetical protein
MESDPFAGDTRRLRAIHEWRRRVGDWRIFFTLSHPHRSRTRHSPADIDDLLTFQGHHEVQGLPLDVDSGSLVGRAESPDLPAQVKGLMW